MFVPLFIPAAECEVWKQFKQLADAECFSALRGGKRCVRMMEKQLRLKPHSLLFVRGLFGCRRKSQQLLSGCGHGVSDPVCRTSMILILYRLCVLYCSTETRNFSDFCVVFLLFLVERRSGNVEREYKGVLANMSQTNLYCNNIL